MYNTILEAQTALIAAIRSRHTLEQELAFLDNMNDPTAVYRIAKKAEIKEVIKTFNDANYYLSARKVYPLRYDTNRIFDFGIETDWDNESEVPGTVLNIYSNQYQPPTLDEIRTSKKNLEKNIDTSSKNLKIKKKELADLQQISDTYPNKADMVAAALSAYKDEIQTYVRLTKLKQYIEKSESITQTKINIENSPKIEDEFSKKIRETIKNTLQSTPNYVEYQFDVEAALIMRKKAIDFYNTAKTIDDKAAAAERLSRTIQSFNSSTEITRLGNTTWTIEDYNQTITDFENSLIAITSLAEIRSGYEVALYDATVAQDQALIDSITPLLATAVANYDAEAHDLKILSDRLTGFHDSKITSIMYPGSTENEIIIPEVSTTVSSNTTVPVGTNAETSQVADATKKDPRLLTPNQINNHLDSRKHNEERLTVVRKEYDDAVIPLQNDINNLEQEKLKHQEVMYKTQETPDATQFNAAVAEVATIDRQIQEKRVAIDNATEAYNLQSAENLKDISIANKALSDSTYLDIPLVGEETKNEFLLSSYNNYQTTQNVLKDTTKEVYRQTQNAQQNAEDAYKLQYPYATQAQIDEHKKNPSNWSPQDKAKVDSAVALNNEAKVNAKTAATKLTGATALESDRTLLQQLTNVPASELRQELAAAINAAQTKIVETPSEGQVSNIDNSYNGFEGINNSSPFYMQMPTLNSITDFHLRNGINPYGKGADEVARHAIHFTVYENTPPASRAEPVPGQPQLIRNIVSGTGRNTIGSFTIYPANPDSLQIQHQHQYTSNDGIASTIIGTAVELANTADSFLNLATTVTDSIKSGREVEMSSKSTRKIDTIDFYQSTEKQALNIEFNLFTKDDFLNDIFKPITFLTALSYPKRGLTGGKWNRLGNLVKDVTDAFKSPKSPSDPGYGLADQIADLMRKVGDSLGDAGNFIEKFEKKLTETGGFGPFRYFITKRPEYITIRHASGLFHFPLAYITGFTYQYMGPWYNYQSANGNVTNGNSHLENVISHTPTPAKQKTIGESWDQLKKDAAGVGKAATDLFTTNPFADKPPESVPSLGAYAERSGSPGESDSLGQLSESKFIQSDVAYPTWAKCTISVKCAHPMFRDDYMQLYYAADKDGKSVVSVTEEQTGFSKNLSSTKRIF